MRVFFDPFREIAVLDRGKRDDGRAHLRAIGGEIIATDDIERRRARRGPRPQGLDNPAGGAFRRARMIDVVANVRMGEIKRAVGAEAIAFFRYRQRNEARLRRGEAFDEALCGARRMDRLLDRSDDPVADRLVEEGERVETGADIPQPTDYVRALKPLLDRFGNDAKLSIIVFTLDETSYARELAPLAGHYPALKLGPAWWFHDSPEGMRRFREQTTETAGFYNLVGFNDDTRAFLSIPARHDVARRVDCAFLARLVSEHRLDLDEAHETAADLAYKLAKSAYCL